jgi:hypothetical protein
MLELLEITAHGRTVETLGGLEKDTSHKWGFGSMLQHRARGSAAKENSSPAVGVGKRVTGKSTEPGSAGGGAGGALRPTTASAMKRKAAAPSAPPMLRQGDSQQQKRSRKPEVQALPGTPDRAGVRDKNLTMAVTARIKEAWTLQKVRDGVSPPPPPKGLSTREKGPLGCAHPVVRSSL